MSSLGVLQLALVVAAISFVINEAYQASLLAGVLATGLVVLTLLVWILSDWFGNAPA
jgi:hypothetical protein